MKRVMLIIPLILALAVPAAAIEKPINLALKGGVNWATFSHDGPESGNFDRGIFYGAGGTLSFNVRPGLDLDADVLYLMKGTKYESSGEDYSLEETAHLNYLVCSPMLRFTPHSYGAGPYFMGGIEIGYLLSAEVEATTTDPEGVHNQTSDIKDGLKNMDFGLAFGAGMEFPGQSVDFFLEGRYAFGLTDIHEDAAGEDSFANSIEDRTRGLYLFGGIRF
jgi:opacity protein-like surface antigen